MSSHRIDLYPPTETPRNVAEPKARSVSRRDDLTWHGPGMDPAVTSARPARALLYRANPYVIPYSLTLPSTRPSM